MVTVAENDPDEVLRCFERNGSQVGHFVLQAKGRVLCPKRSAECSSLGCVGEVVLTRRADEELLTILRCWWKA